MTNRSTEQGKPKYYYAMSRLRRSSRASEGTRPGSYHTTVGRLQALCTQVPNSFKSPTQRRSNTAREVACLVSALSGFHMWVLGSNGGWR
jgi:hypothetical protein